mmetsp:Transcript_6548/g.9574  ORF Transcript_6548/g.9574 Transcript_6548/m.9574 type:complete len:324 (-) Transcript_6548:349-1320(-)
MTQPYSYWKMKLICINLAFLPFAASFSMPQGASSLIQTLVNDEKCFTTDQGAQTFADACATNIVYEDCFEPQPIVGRMNVAQHMKGKVDQRKGKGDFRLDRISDGKTACGFAWTWTCGDEEGLRGTTFVELNDRNEIQYVREIPEPIYKPGDLTLDLLKAVTEGAEPKVLPPLVEREPKEANDLVKYLFNEVQGRDVEESMKFFSESIRYRDFNYEDILKGKAEVQKFIEDFSFPGIEFRAQRFDDGILSTCFTWEVAVMDAPDTIKGISFYELDADTRQITYVRDVPESAIKPPILGKIARQLRPGLGTFQGVKIGSRPGGL